MAAIESKEQIKVLLIKGITEIALSVLHIGRLNNLQKAEENSQRQIEILQAKIAQLEREKQSKEAIIFKMSETLKSCIHS